MIEPMNPRNLTDDERTVCGNCPHVKYDHFMPGSERCEIEGCPCPGFLTVAHPIEREAASPAALDVERLARVTHRRRDHALGGVCDFCRREAAWIAAEYARLTEQEDRHG